MKPGIGTFVCALGVVAGLHGSANGLERPRPPEPPGYLSAPPPPNPDPGRHPFPDPNHPEFGRPEPPRPGAPAFVARPDAGPPGWDHHEPPRGRVCFDPAATREAIVTHRLADPFHALRDGRLQGEALRARLCRWRPDEFIYEIALLLRDGRIVHIYMDARTGQTVGALEPRR